MVVDVKFGKDVGEVDLYGVWVDVEVVGDFFVGVFVCCYL